MELDEVEEYLKEVNEVAERAGYRLQMEDIHLLGVKLYWKSIELRVFQPFVESDSAGASATSKRVCKRYF